MIPIEIVKAIVAVARRQWADNSEPPPTDVTGKAQYQWLDTWTRFHRFIIPVAMVRAVISASL